MRIAVLAGGISPERNVSLAGGKAAAAALRERGHSVVFLDPALGAEAVLDDTTLYVSAAHFPGDELARFSTRNLLDCIQLPVFDSVDCAFLLTHGKNGEDGVLQALLQARGVRYTGSKVMSSALAMDKIASKLIFSAIGVTTPPWAVVRAGETDDSEHLEHILDELRGNVVVKPNDQGSTVGMSIVRNDLEDLRRAVELAARYSDAVLIEQCIEGRELTVAILGREALPVLEIEPEGGFYDYEHKYTKGKTLYHCPADIYAETADFVSELAMTAHRALGCAAYSRVDFRLDEENVPYCLEVNTIPGFTATSLVPMAAQARGISFGELCERIIELS